MVPTNKKAGFKTAEKGRAKILFVKHTNMPMEEKIKQQQPDYDIFFIKLYFDNRIMQHYRSREKRCVGGRRVKWFQGLPPQ
jgi:hypothetical protein